jgi:hypothetical protein
MRPIIEDQCRGKQEMVQLEAIVHPHESVISFNLDTPAE